jgi:hypothetical protein
MIAYGDIQARPRDNLVEGIIGGGFEMLEYATAKEALGSIANGKPTIFRWSVDVGHGFRVEISEELQEIAVALYYPREWAEESFQAVCEAVQPIVEIISKWHAEHNGQLPVHMQMHAAREEKQIDVWLEVRVIADKTILQLTYFFPPSWQEAHFQRAVTTAKRLIKLADAGCVKTGEPKLPLYAVWLLGEDLPSDTAEVVMKAAKDEEMNTRITFTVFVSSHSFVTGMVRALGFVAKKLAANLGFELISYVEEVDQTIARHLPA